MGSMVGLDRELDALEALLRAEDVAAATLSIRRIVEALLRHAAREEGIKVSSGPESVIQRLSEELRPKLKDRLPPTFWAHLEPIQKFGNWYAHSQIDEVYRPAAPRPSSIWGEVRPCIDHLTSVVDLFISVYPPPRGARSRRPERPKGSGDDVAQPAPAKPAKRVSSAAQLTAEELGALSVTQALTLEGAHERIQELSGISPAWVTRRIKKVHGRTLLRNLFPGLGQPEDDEDDEEDDPGGADDGDDGDEVGFDYDALGELTVRAVREHDLVPEIAALTGWSELKVTRRLNDLPGRAIVRRQFPWHDPEVIGELTVRTAIDFGMARALGRQLHKWPKTIAGLLADRPGQTKLRTVFPELDE